MKTAVSLSLLAVLVFGNAEGSGFNYGLWNQKQPAQRNRSSGQSSHFRKPASRDFKFSWKDFLPKDLPKPFVKLLEEPNDENIRKYWNAYEEYAERLFEAEKRLRLFQIKYARKISKEYSLLYFFSPDCPACKEYTPKLFAELLKEGFSVPVKAYVVGDYRRGALMMSSLGVSTTRTATDRMLSEFNVEALPTAVILDSEGNFVNKYSGGEVLQVVNFLKEKRNEEITAGANATEQ